MSISHRMLAWDLVGAPFNIERAIHSLGQALWLYVWLVLHANRLGLICRTVESLAQDLLTQENDIGLWLERLVQAKLVLVQNPPPYLVLKLCSWSNSRQDSQESSAALTRAPAPVRVGSSKLLQAAAENNNSKQASSGEVGGAGEGEPLLARAHAVLGPADEAELADVLAQHPEELVRTALRRVERTPISQIRKSKYALFRYLLVKLPHEAHDRDSQN